MKSITKEQEYFLYRFTRGTWELNQETKLVDIDVAFNCSDQNLPDFLGIEFGKIKNDFNCSHNKLVSLEGAPRNVGGDFDCSHNKLVSLEDAPQKVLEDFICDPITLRGCPINLLNKIYFYNNKRNKIDEYLIKIINTLDPYLYFKKMI